MTKLRQTHMCHQSSQHIKDRIKLKKKRNEYYLIKIQRIEELDKLYRQTRQEYEEQYPRLEAGGQVLDVVELQLKEQKLKQQLEQLRALEYERQMLMLEIKRDIDNVMH